MPSAGTAVNQRINEVFARLEPWHLVLRFDQKGPSPEGSYDYHPKRYLFDTGLLKQMRESGLPALIVLENRPSDSRGPLGRLLENQMAIEIARSGLEQAGWKKNLPAARSRKCRKAEQDGEETRPGSHGWWTHRKKISDILTLTSWRSRFEGLVHIRYKNTSVFRHKPCLNLSNMFFKPSIQVKSIPVNIP